jgi:hypothetical protein
MVGDPSWFTFAVLIGGALFVMALVAVSRAAKGLTRVDMAVECPGAHRTARLVALQSETTGQYVDVVGCSELKGDVTCDRACLQSANRAKLKTV